MINFYDMEIVINEIEKFPHTYKTLLGDKCKSGTCQTVVRRKINKMLKQGRIQKMVIPGTRFGKVIFFSQNKKYNIIVESSRIGSIVYCFFNYKKLNRWYIEINNYWKLESGLWEKYNNKKSLFDGNILKWI